MIAETIKFALSNFTQTFFLIGMLFSAVATVRAPKPVSNAVAVEKILSWFVFWTIGVAYFYNFVFHVFFGEMAANSSAGPTARSNSKSEWRASDARSLASLRPFGVSTCALPRSCLRPFSCSARRWGTSIR